MSRLFHIALSVLIAILFAAALPTHADDQSNVRIVRVSFLQGDVQYHPEGKESRPAALNLAIEQGFALQTGDGFAEVEFENYGLVLRLAKDSSVVFTKLALVDGHRLTRLTFSQGSAIFTARLSHNDELSVATSNLNLNVPHSGRFRIDVSPKESRIIVFSGKVDVASPSGITLLRSRQTLHEQGTDTKSMQVVRSQAADAFDRWDSQREDALIAGQSLPTGASTPTRNPKGPSPWDYQDSGTSSSAKSGGHN